MLKIFNPSVISVVINLLIIALVAKILSLALWFYLPSNGYELKERKNYQPKYHRVVFNSMLSQPKKIQKRVKKPKNDGISITNMILKGLYGKDDKGFAIVALKSSPKKTSLISIGESFSGYKLIYINLDSVVFKKANKEYILELIKPKNSTKKIKKKKKVTYSKAVLAELSKPKVVNRSDISYYAKHPKQIWRDISIKEVKKGGRIYGFKIYRINPRSKFAKLGLRRGDIIISANNTPLTSYKAAFDVYNSVDTVDTMQIVILRDNEEMEFVYEIN